MYRASKNRKSNLITKDDITNYEFPIDINVRNLDNLIKQIDPYNPDFIKFTDFSSIEKIKKSNCYILLGGFKETEYFEFKTGKIDINEKDFISYIIYRGIYYNNFFKVCYNISASKIYYNGIRRINIPFNRLYWSYDIITKKVILKDLIRVVGDIMEDNDAFWKDENIIHTNGNLERTLDAGIFLKGRVA